MFSGLTSDGGFRSILAQIESFDLSNVEKGRVFEKIVKAFLQQDKAQSERFSRVWLWNEWPGNRGETDTGVDIVARERDTGDIVAIQCKFWARSTTLYLNDIATFLAKCGQEPFKKGIIVSTTEKWGPNIEKSLRGREKPISRWGVSVFEYSSIDWAKFDLDTPSEVSRKRNKTLRNYQEDALRDTMSGFESHDRGKLIMACGSGKTFTALRIAERVAGVGGTALFLTPSISLLSQSLIDWANDADLPLKTLAVCSDTRAGRRSSSDEDMSPYDLTDSPSTDPTRLVERFRRADREGSMTVVFSTYQSLDVVAEAQKNGLPEFDIIIADEAHRTTGVSAKKLTGKDESNFQRVHDNGFISGRKRLYMTATPRIFGDRARRKANDSQLVLASMDDERLYGPEFHRLGFGKAIELGILSDYKVIIFNVDEEQVGIDLDSLLSDSESDINMDNAARMVGCWNGLGKRAAEGVDFGDDTHPAKRAVAFSNVIKHSKLFTNYFPDVIDSCINAAGDEDGNRLRCEVDHVDGSQNALHRANRLAWLREDPEDGVCKILSNARCLTEGIDVPALDAILFLQPRRSEIDVVQAVGRVMRKSPGKKFGYIILPIAQAPGVSPQDSVNDSAYKAVWQVINAISAHDDRFEAKINHLALTIDNPEPDPKDKYLRGDPTIADAGNGYVEGESDDPGSPEGIQGMLLIAGSPELRDAILAKVVDKYADPRYWEKWADNIGEIARRHESRIRALLNVPNSEIRETFDDFLLAIRGNLNDGITEDDAIGMLSQHLVTKPVFDALFTDYDFSTHNPVSRAMQSTLDKLANHGLEKETEGLENFYRDVRIRAEGVSSAEDKQKIIAELYERFIQRALPYTARNLGIVYTPTELVDYVVRSVEDVLQENFGVSVSDAGVHVMDPFVGTGTFITRLLQSGLIKPEDLKRKYGNELHANEFVLLAYYIAAINIEAIYHDMADTEEYQPFDGMVLTDTFQSSEAGDPMDEALFPRNNARIERQKALDIRVIMGNPPWSATNNRSYPTIDDRVKKSYAEASNTKHLSALYDPYVKAIRQASDRVLGSDKGGVVAFVTNGGFIDSNAFDGFRKAVVSDFHSIYCFDLRGDQRTAGEQSRREGGKIFGSGSRARVAILLLVKKPGESLGATIHYCDIGDYLTRQEKLDTLSALRLNSTDWQVITPNEHGDWINQRNQDFSELRPLALEDINSYTSGTSTTPVFMSQSLGLQTGRDAWCYNSSSSKLRYDIQRSVDFYNQQLTEFIKTNPTGLSRERIAKAKAYVKKDPQQFHWREEVYRNLVNEKDYSINDTDFVVGTYRPFFKQRLYFSTQLNCRIREFPRIYPSAQSRNLGISIVSQGSNNPFHVLMTDNIPDSELTSHTIYLCRYRYTPSGTMSQPVSSSQTLERVSNINPNALTQFREQYDDPGITEDDLFYYTYGVLHSQQYRDTFANDLSKVPARIPMAASLQDFRTYADAGRELGNLHVNYESVEPYPLDEIHAEGWNPDAPNAYRVEKMTYPGQRANQDKTRIIYNAGITLAGIPERAHEYRLGSRSALDWLIDRYQVSTHKASGIVNDPNDWATEHDQPRYILDLIKRVTTVSLRTMDIVNKLPELPI